VAITTVVDEPFLIYNLKTNGHCVGIKDASNLLGSVGGSDERNAVEFVAVSVKKVDEVGHDFLSFSFLSLTSYIDIIPKILELSTPLLDFF
jgi:hypothetical protein